MSCTEMLVWILFHGYRLNWIPSLTIRQYLVFNFKWGSFSPYVKVQTPTHCQTPVFYESYHLPPTPMCDYYLLPFIWCGWCALKRPINQLISKKIAAADLSLTSAPTRREETGIERGVRASPLRVWLRGGIKVLSLSLSHCGASFYMEDHVTPASHFHGCIIICRSPQTGCSTNVPYNKTRLTCTVGVCGTLPVMFLFNYWTTGPVLVHGLYLVVRRIECDVY